MAFSAPYNDAISYSDPDVNGKVRFSAPGGELDLQFTWEVLASLQARWDGPDNEFNKRVTEALDRAKIEDLAIVTSEASGMTFQEVMDMAPPINHLCDALTLAWSHAWNGGEPPEQEESDAGKNTAWPSLFGWRVRVPFVRA